jgi:hypothetical protein
MPKPTRFRAVLERDDKTSATPLPLPFDVEQAFGRKGRLPVRGTLNGVGFRSTLAPYGGVHYLPVNRALREKAGVDAGDTVEVVLEIDDQPRLVEAPADLARALARRARAKAAWDKLATSHRRAYVEAVEEAKKPETRRRRIAGVVEALSAR